MITAMTRRGVTASNRSRPVKVHSSVRAPVLPTDIRLTSGSSIRKTKTHAALLRAWRKVLRQQTVGFQGSC